MICQAMIFKIMKVNSKITIDVNIENIPQIFLLIQEIKTHTSTYFKSSRLFKKLASGVHDSSKGTLQSSKQH